MSMYSVNVDGNVAKARVEEVDASFKELSQVCRNIKGMDVESALKLLDDVIAGKRPIRFYTHNKKMGHRKELGGQKGRWPKKAARIVKQVLQNAIANARYKNMSFELYVFHAAANKKRNYPRLQPKGRRIRHDYETSRVEIILKEVVKSGDEKHKN